MNTLARLCFVLVLGLPAAGAARDAVSEADSFVVHYRETVTRARS